MFTLYNGDCLEKMKDIPDGSINLIVTSPPYNNYRNRRTQQQKKEFWDRTNIVYNSYSDDLSDEDYFDWQKNFINECMRCLTPDGVLAYNHKDLIHDFEVISPMSWILASDGILKQRITWDRMGCQAINPVRFFRKEEDIYIIGKRGKPKFNPEFAKLTSIWRVLPSKKNGHPAPFPVELPELLIKSFTDINDVVLDPFMGSGTTGVACVNTNRNFVGIELDVEYFKLAQERIEKASNTLDLGDLG